MQFDHSTITGLVIELYRRICDSIRSADKLSPRHAEEAAELLTELRALAVELADMLNIEDGPYPPEARIRLKLIERELVSLTSRLRSITSTISHSL